MSVPRPEQDCWLHPDIAVGPSLIAGRGLVATAPIAGGTVVSRVGGKLVSDAALRELRAGTSAGAPVSIVVDDDVHLVLPVDAPNRFVNHSCEPSAGWSDEYTLVLLHDVAAGTEITSDYATSMIDKDFVLWCHCETYRCRQVIEGTDWQIPQLQQRYAGQWIPYVQRLIDAAH